MTINFNNIRDKLSKLPYEASSLKGTDDEQVESVINSLYTNIAHSERRSLADQGDILNLAEEIAKEVCNQCKDIPPGLTDKVGALQRFLHQKKSDLNKQVEVGLLEESHEAKPIVEKGKLETVKSEVETLIPSRGKGKLEIENLAVDTQKLGKLLAKVPDLPASEIGTIKETFFKNFSDFLHLEMPNKKGLVNEFVTYASMIDPSLQKLRQMIQMSGKEFPANSIKWMVDGLEEGLTKSLYPNAMTQGLVKATVANFHAIQSVAGNQGGLEAAFYFAEALPDKRISPSENLMMKTLQPFAGRIDEANKAFLKIPLPTEAFSELKGQYMVSSDALNNAIQMTRKFIPSFNSQSLLVGVLSPEEFDQISEVNRTLQNELEAVLDHTSQRAVLMAYIAARNRILAQIESLRKIIPEYDEKKFVDEIMRHEDASKIGLINLGIMDSRTAAGNNLPPLEAAQDAVKVIAEIEAAYLVGLYNAKDHEEFYRKAWQNLEDNLSRAKQLEPGVNSQTVTRDILRKNAIIELDRRTHETSIEGANQKLDEYRAAIGNWILLYDEQLEKMVLATRSSHGVSEREIDNNDGLRPLLQELANGIIHKYSVTE